MTRTQVLLALLVASAVRAQNVCPAASTQLLYGLVAQPVAVDTGATVCKDYFRTNGACATAASTQAAMNTHNSWLASKADDAQNYALQYINATIYWQTQNGYINSNTAVSTDNSWWNSVTNTLSSWWTAISNRATALFKSAYAWVRNVFSNTVAGIPPCLNSWGNITNGAYCLTASSSNIFSKMDATSNNDLAWAVDLTTTGQALTSCEPLIDNYCQMSFGVSINNDSAPFNQTFNWGDAGVTVDTCNNIRTQKKCGASCNAALYNIYITMFESYWVRFVPSSSYISNLGQFLNTNANHTAFKPSAGTTASGQKSLRIFVPGTGNTANIISIGQNSGQKSQNYITASNSAAKLLASLVCALIAMMF